MKKVILVDSNSLLYRSYYALPNLSTKDGFPTGGIYGFFSHFIIVGDAKGVLARSLVFKNTRPIDRRLLMSFHCKEKSYLTYWAHSLYHTLCMKGKKLMIPSPH